MRLTVYVDGGEFVGGIKVVIIFFGTYFSGTVFLELFCKNNFP